MAQEGYSAPFVLQDILTQKRAAQHQKLVDSLNLVQAQAEMENAAKRQEQAEAEARATAEYRTGQLAESAADRESREKIAMMPPRLAPESPVYTFDEASGKYSPAMAGAIPVMTRGTNTINTRNRPPQGPQPQNPQYLFADPKTGKAVFASEGQTFTMNEKGGRELYTGEAGTKPTAASVGGPSPAEFNKLADLRGKATTGPARMFGMRAGKEADPKAVAAYQQQRDNIITRYKASPAIVDAVMNAMEEDPSVPLAEIIADVEASGATPEELAKFKEMMTIAGRR